MLRGVMVSENVVMLTVMEMRTVMKVSVESIIGERRGKEITVKKGEGK